jgi:hypothetical protein
MVFLYEIHLAGPGQASNKPESTPGTSGILTADRDRTCEYRNGPLPACNPPSPGQQRDYALSASMRLRNSPITSR